MGGGSLLTPAARPAVRLQADASRSAPTSCTAPIFKTVGACAAPAARQRARAPVGLDVHRQRADVAGRRLARRRGSRTATATTSSRRCAKVLGAALLFGGARPARRRRSCTGRPGERRAVPPDAPRPRRSRSRSASSAASSSGSRRSAAATFFALSMLLVFPLTAAKIVGTDIFHAAALLWVAGVGHFVPATSISVRWAGSCSARSRAS